MAIFIVITSLLAAAVISLIFKRRAVIEYASMIASFVVFRFRDFHRAESRFFRILRIFQIFFSGRAGGDYYNDNFFDRARVLRVFHQLSPRRNREADNRIPESQAVFYFIQLICSGDVFRGHHVKSDHYVDRH